MAMALIDMSCRANASPLHQPIGIFRIFHPIRRIVENVLPDGIQFLVVTDDVLVVITLPHRLAGRLAHLINAPGRDRFEIPNDCAERSGDETGLKRCNSIVFRRKQPQNTVKMIRHHDKGIEFYLRHALRNPLPQSLNDPAQHRIVEK